MTLVHSPSAHTHSATDISVLAPCQKCGALAVWEMAPSDSFGEYCEGCVPRGCSCNQTFNDASGEWDGPERTEDDGRLLPCCEYWYWPDGFEPGDPEGPAKHRAAAEKARTAVDGPSVGTSNASEPQTGAHND